MEHHVRSHTIAPRAARPAARRERKTEGPDAGGGEFDESLVVTIEGGEVSAPAGVPVMLAAVLEGETDDLALSWFVNGEIVSCASATIEVSRDAPGRYRVDLLVVNEDGARGGMSTTWIEVVR